MDKNTKLLLALAGGVLIGWLLTSNGILPPTSYITKINPRGTTIYHAALLPK